MTSVNQKTLSIIQSVPINHTIESSTLINIGKENTSLLNRIIYCVKNVIGWIDLNATYETRGKDIVLLYNKNVIEQKLAQGNNEKIQSFITVFAKNDHVQQLHDSVTYKYVQFVRKQEWKDNLKEQEWSQLLINDNETVKELFNTIDDYKTYGIDRKLSRAFVREILGEKKLTEVTREDILKLEDLLLNKYLSLDPERKQQVLEQKTLNALDEAVQSAKEEAEQARIRAERANALAIAKTNVGGYEPIQELLKRNPEQMHILIEQLVTSQVVIDKMNTTGEDLQRNQECLKKISLYALDYMIKIESASPSEIAQGITWLIETKKDLESISNWIGGLGETVSRFGNYSKMEKELFAKVQSIHEEANAPTPNLNPVEETAPEEPLPQAVKSAVEKEPESRTCNEFVGLLQQSPIEALAAIISPYLKAFIPADSHGVADEFAANLVRLETLTNDVPTVKKGLDKLKKKLKTPLVENIVKGVVLQVNETFGKEKPFEEYSKLIDLLIREFTASPFVIEEEVDISKPVQKTSDEETDEETNSGRTIIELVAKKFVESAVKARSVKSKIDKQLDENTSQWSASRKEQQQKIGKTAVGNGSEDESLRTVRNQIFSNAILEAHKPFLLSIPTLISHKDKVLESTGQLSKLLKFLKRTGWVGEKAISASIEVWFKFDKSIKKKSDAEKAAIKNSLLAMMKIASSINPEFLEKHDLKSYFEFLESVNSFVQSKEVPTKEEISALHMNLLKVMKQALKEFSAYEDGIKASLSKTLDQPQAVATK